MQTRILVVDDDQELLAVLKVQLSERGFEVAAATTGTEAFEKVDAFCPHLVLLDLILPGTDGIVLCEKLKQHPKTSSVPIILMTGISSQMVRYNAFESGADAYLAKPFDPGSLLEKIEVLLYKADTPTASDRN